MTRLALLLVVFAGCAPAPVFTVPDRAGLAAHLAFDVVTRAAPPAPTPEPAGKVCPECAPDGKPLFPDHPGQVGDGTVFMPCPNPDCPWKPKAPPPVTVKPAAKPVAVSAGPTWDWQGNMNPSTAEMIRHLEREHRVVGSSLRGMSRAELRELHDLLHNEQATRRSTTTTRSCPTGTCPNR